MIGQMSGKKFNTFVDNKKWFIWAMISLLYIGAVFLYFREEMTPFIPETYSEYERLFSLLSIAGAVLGSGFFCGVVKITCQIGFLGKLLSYLGKNTWYIYLLHTYFTAAARVLIRFLEVENIYVEIVSSLIIACGIPLLIAFFVKKIWFLDIFFYPRKYRNKFRKG